MICLCLVFLNEFWDGVTGKTFLNNPEKLAVCSVWEIMLETPLLCFLV